MKKIERRFTANPLALFDNGTASNKGKRVRGYAALFNVLSQDLGGFVELLSPGAFGDLRKADCRCLWNHNPSDILAPSKFGKGTLQIGTDSRGLWYEFEAPDTQVGRDLLVSLKRGDVDQSSFGFIVGKDRWSAGSNGLPQRTILEVSRLLDVSPVTYPATESTTSGAIDSLGRSKLARTSRTGPLGWHDAKLRILRLAPKI